MYPQIRHEKRHPDGTLRRVGLGYRLPAHRSVTRIYVPAGSRLWHANGVWVSDAATVSLFDPSWPFVPHFYDDPADPRLYIDIARSVTVEENVVSYTDLYLDIGVSQLRGVSEKDEQLLERLTAHEAAAVRDVRDSLRARITQGDPIFDRHDAIWRVPDDARMLAPLAVERP